VEVGFFIDKNHFHKVGFLICKNNYMEREQLLMKTIEFNQWALTLPGGTHTRLARSIISIKKELRRELENLRIQTKNELSE
jgi:hypothetical protein